MLYKYKYTSNYCVHIIDEEMETDWGSAVGAFSKPKWFENVKSEYWACREGVCVIDMSTFTKFELKVKFESYLVRLIVILNLPSLTMKGRICGCEALKLW